MSHNKVIAAMCLAALSASLLASTTDPPQVQSIFPLPVSFPTGNWVLDSTWKLSNSGSGTYIHDLCADLHTPDDGTTAYQAGYATYALNMGIYTGSVSLLGVSETVSPATARCMTYGGIAGGQLYDPSALILAPTVLSGSSVTYLLDGATGFPGLFWDVNHDANNQDTFAGFYFDGTNNQGCVWNSSYLTGPKFPDRTGYAGSECRCINSSDDVGGQVFTSSSGNPPAFWFYTGGTPPWTLVSLSSSSDWPSGRDGYIVGVHDRDSSNNIYAVGYMTDSSMGAGDGKPFVYTYASGGGSIRFLSTQYGPPTQIRNYAYDVSDPIICFSGNSSTTGLAYTWLGSPDKFSTLTGVFDDIWAFMDPDVARYSTSSDDPFAPTITGVNNDTSNSVFEFGGNVQTKDNGLQPWITIPSAWNMGSAPDYNVTTGYLETGSTKGDLVSANGKFAKFRNGSTILPLDPQIVVEADWTVPNPMDVSEVGFRATAQLEINVTTSTYRIEFWNTNTGRWDRPVTTTMPNYWQTQVATFNVSGGSSPYIDSNNLVKARITIYASTGALSWDVDVDQMVFMSKPT